MVPGAHPLVKRADALVRHADRACALCRAVVSPLHAICAGVDALVRAHSMMCGPAWTIAIACDRMCRLVGKG